MKNDKMNMADSSSLHLQQALCCVPVDCLRCGKPLENKRKKFCCDSCKYWYNQIKKEKERLLAPFRKRSEKWFFMVVGSKWAKSGRQGKRVGHMVTGSMAAMVSVTVEKLVEVNDENIIKHFLGIPGYQPSYMRLGTEEKIFKKDVTERFGVVLP